MAALGWVGMIFIYLILVISSRILMWMPADCMVPDTLRPARGDWWYRRWHHYYQKSPLRPLLVVLLLLLLVLVNRGIDNIYIYIYKMKQSSASPAILVASLHLSYDLLLITRSFGRSPSPAGPARPPPLLYTCVVLMLGGLYGSTGAALVYCTTAF